MSCNLAPWLPGPSDLRSLLGALPLGVPVLVAPLMLTERGVRTVAGVAYERERLVAAYLAEHHRLGHLERVDFSRPSATAARELRHPPAAPRRNGLIPSRDASTAL